MATEKLCFSYELFVGVNRDFFDDALSWVTEEMESYDTDNKIVGDS